MSDSDGEEDSFHDAMEYLPKPDRVELAVAIDEAKIALDLFMNNRFDEAKAIMKPSSQNSMYHALGTGVFQFLEAVMTFEPLQIEAAVGVLEDSVDVCNKFRKKSSVYESLGKMVRRRPNYDALLEEEIHAELCYAECLLLRAALAFMEDENMLSFIRGGLKMRSCLHAYRECWSILRHRNWEAETKHKIHFESGTRMGIGAYNLMISLLPARIMKILEFIGFAGSRDDCKETGMEQLMLGNCLDGSLRQVLCGLVLLGFNLFVSYILGYGDGDLELCNQIINNQLSEYPQGIWFPFFKGRLEYVQGHIERAIEYYTKAWQSQQEWIQFHHLCFWELMFCNSYLMDWPSARDFADLLLHESRWSKAIYGYQKASFMCMMQDKLENDQKTELEQLFRDIPKWKQRIAGKSIPLEKFIVKKCERFFNQGHKLVLPALELTYLWNGFKILGKQIELVQPLLLLVEKHIKLNEKDIDSPHYADNKGLLLLLKGMCYKCLHSPHLAEETFKKLIAMEKELVADLYVVPYAMYELGIIQWSDGHRDVAMTTLENSKNNYKGYALESRLHFRIHSALADMKFHRKRDDPSFSKISNPNYKHRKNPPF